jgi:hypothetical protein
MGMTTGNYHGNSAAPLSVNTGLGSIKSLVILRLNVATGATTAAYTSDALNAVMGAGDYYFEYSGNKGTAIRLFGPTFQIPAGGHPYNTTGYTYVWEANCP